MNRPRLAALTTGIALSAVLLTGCATAQGAIDQAQGVVDDAQSLVDSAASIASAPDSIAEACATALEGTAPGTPVEVAQEAVAAATAQIDEALGIAGALPIVSDFRDVLVGTAESLVNDGSEASVTAARQAIEGVCAITQ